MKTGKNIKIFGVRGSMIGDQIFALPVLDFLEKKLPGSYKIWQIARSFSQSTPLYYNHPLIDRLVISDCDEGMGPNDIALAKQCDYVINVMPQHPEGDEWVKKRTVWSETFLMAGFSMEQYNELTEEEKCPKLVRWFVTPYDKVPDKTISIWPCASYGKEPKRYPKREWYLKLVGDLLAQGYNIWQFGHPKDFSIYDSSVHGPTDGIKYRDLRELPFMEQIQLSLACDAAIGTDSGSAIVLGAYRMPNQVSLLTNHWNGHPASNPYAFSTNSPLNTSFFAPDGASNIDVNAVKQKIIELTS